jgi:hypothetical protein
LLTHLLTKHRIRTAACATAAACAAAAALGTAALPDGGAAQAAAAGTAARATAQHADAPHSRPSTGTSGATSSNWAGYAASGGRWKQVSAGWRQPTADCRAGDGVSAFWVGLDGATSGTVEQIGTDSDCTGGRPDYYGWFEMYPSAPVDLGTRIRAGDHMWASVATRGNGWFTLRLVDITRNWSRSEQRRLSTARLASAEVIAEAPSSSSGGVEPLTDFGSVGFLGAGAGGGTLGSAGPQRLTMVGGGGTVKAAPSGISDGKDFTVAWHHR